MSYIEVKMDKITEQNTPEQPKENSPLDNWLDENIKRPYGGFEQYGSTAQQIAKTKEQLRIAADDFKRMGKPDEEIQKIIEQISKGLRDG